jgi:hypothetical protein
MQKAPRSVIGGRASVTWKHLRDGPKELMKDFSLNSLTA